MVQHYQRTVNSDLFAVIGTTYGAGNGSTTFNIPDLRDYCGLDKGVVDAGRDGTHKNLKP